MVSKCATRKKINEQGKYRKVRYKNESKKSVIIELNKVEGLEG